MPYDPASSLERAYHYSQYTVRPHLLNWLAPQLAGIIAAESNGIGLAGKGISGHVLVAAVMLELERLGRNCSVMLVRDPDVKSHGYSSAMSKCSGGLRWWILDDFTESGDTVQAIYGKLYQEFGELDCRVLMTRGHSYLRNPNHVQVTWFGEPRQLPLVNLYENFNSLEATYRAAHKKFIEVPTLDVNATVLEYNCSKSKNTDIPVKFCYTEDPNQPSGLQAQINQVILRSRIG